MAQLGWGFETMDSGVDENQLKGLGLSARDLALRLAKLKAESIFSKYPEACVIGSDQVCAIDGRVLGKPKTIEKAIEQLNLLQGRSHELLTAVSVRCPIGEESFVSQTTLHMRELSLNQISSYILEDSPLDCAGSYKLESKGIKLFKEIHMSDHTAIIGLPLIELTTLLINLGYSL